MLLIVLLTDDDILLQFNHFSQRLILLIKLYSHHSLPRLPFRKMVAFCCCTLKPKHAAQLSRHAANQQFLPKTQNWQMQQGGDHEGTDIAMYSFLFLQPCEDGYWCYMNCRQKLKMLPQKRGNKWFREAHTKYTVSNTGMIIKEKMY